MGTIARVNLQNQQEKDWHEIKERFSDSFEPEGGDARGV
jgi:hypothetical protein